MKRTLAFTLVLLLSLVSMGYAAGIPTVTPDQLKQSLNDPNVTILDVRTGYDWDTSNYKIQGAHRAAPDDFGEWSKKYDKNGRYILYCA